VLTPDPALQESHKSNRGIPKLGGAPHRPARERRRGPPPDLAAGRPTLQHIPFNSTVITCTAPRSFCA